MSEYIEREKVYEMLHRIGGCDAEPHSFADGWDKAIDTAIKELGGIPTIDRDLSNEMDLKPCPFCGTNEIFSEFYNSHRTVYKINMGCKKCNYCMTIDYYTKEDYGYFTKRLKQCL